MSACADRGQTSDSPFYSWPYLVCKKISFSDIVFISIKLQISKKYDQTWKSGYLEIYLLFDTIANMITTLRKVSHVCISACWGMFIFVVKTS